MKIMDRISEKLDRRKGYLDLTQKYQHVEEDRESLLIRVAKMFGKW